MVSWANASPHCTLYTHQGTHSKLCCAVYAVCTLLLTLLRCAVVLLSQHVMQWLYFACSEYRMAESFRGRKLSRFGTKREFRGGEKTFADCSGLIIMWVWLQNFAEKTFTDGSETVKNAKVFRYVVYQCSDYHWCLSNAVNVMSYIQWLLFT